MYAVTKRKTIFPALAGLLLLFATLLPPTAAAQGRTLDAEDVEGWYGGVLGGFPFGFSNTSTSFGADQTRFGWTAVLYGGYRFNPVLSLEAQAMWGKVHMTALDDYRGLWLCDDGRPYEAPQSGMDGWAYDHLQSDAALQRYGLQLNVNVLGFFPRTHYSRWSLELSPLLAAVGARTHYRDREGGETLKTFGRRWHLGAGGNLQVNYRIGRRFIVGIYTNAVCLTGKKMDEMPHLSDRANIVWDTGLNLGWFFGKGKHK